MTPPNGIPPPQSPTVPVALATSEQERADFLSTSRLFRDEADASDPLHWARRWEEDQSFRTSRENRELYLTLVALRRFFETGQISPEERTRIGGWTDGAAANPGTMEAVVLQNLQRILPQFQTEPNRSQAQEIAEVLGVAPSAFQVPQTDAEEDRALEQDPSGFQVDGFTLSTHFADEAMRPLPSYYTLTALPQEGLGQSLSSTFGASLGVDWSVGEFDFFTEIYGGDGMPQGNPQSNFGQAGIRFGIREYSRGLGFGSFDGFRLSVLGGMNRSGFGLGMGWCADIQDSEVSGVECEDQHNSFQISAFSESDLITLGYGPVELGVRTWFNNSTATINLGGNVLPESDRDPLSFRLTYYLQDPMGPAAQPTMESLFPTSISDAEVMRAGFNLSNNFFLNNFRRRQEAAYETTRILVVGGAFGGPGGASQYSLLNLGSFFNGAFNGLAEGGLAYRLSRDLRLGNTGQQAFLGALMGGEFLINLIGALATPGDDSAGVRDLQAQAFRMAYPANLAQASLAVLGAAGAFGNRDEAIRSPELGHFQIAHGGLLLAGAILILTSGDFSGDGFLGGSILGNQLPSESGFEITDSRFSLDSQRFQFLRLEIGAMALAYGLAGLIEWIGGRLSYLNIQQRQGEESTEEEQESSVPPISFSIDTDGHSRFMGMVQGPLM